MFRVIPIRNLGLLAAALLAAAAVSAAEHVKNPHVTLSPESAFLSQYQGLRAELQRHRVRQAAGGWPRVPEGPTLHPGSTDPRLGALARRLAASGDLPDSQTAPSHFDETLERAVRRFQGRHGLTVDGLVGRATLRALNTTIEQRIDQIRVNLERMLSPTKIDNRNLILVNIAAFSATVTREGHTIWTTKVIVGGPEDQTPELNLKLVSVVFNPTWSVPHSIASEELLHKVKQDQSFFVNDGYQVYDRDGNRVDPAVIDWSVFDKDNFPFRLVQLPGSKNQLGQIKFIVPNPYSVCMHDTPAKYLFASSKRALSHGCIRVDDPLAFAEVVLADEGWTRERIDSKIASGATKTVELSKPLSVVVVYWTASVDESGEIRFYDDIYGLDAKILKALQRRDSLKATADP